MCCHSRIWRVRKCFPVISEKLFLHSTAKLHVSSFGVHWNWAKLDPWFMFREYLHLMHPRSPLSSTTLVHQAFFSPQYSRANVVEWQRWMPGWESLRWPIGMMRSFVSFPNILENLVGLGRRGAHVCIIAGSEDKLVGVQIPRRLAKTFREAVRASTERKKIDQSVIGIEDGKEFHINGVSFDTSLGVRFVAIEGAAHHFQNDVHQEVGARQLLKFLEELK